MKRVWLSCLFVLFVTSASAQQALDLFQDVPELDANFVRIGAWNLRHINIEGDADEFLVGNTEEDDFDILIATFAAAIEDLELDVVAISEHQPTPRAS